MSDRKIIVKSFIFTIYLSVSFYILLQHEVWRDEVDVLLMVQTTDYTDFLEYLRYSGHPGLFHFFAKTLNSLGFGLEGIRIGHFIISAFALGIFYFFSPFSIWLSSSVLFGNYFLYRFPSFVRNYSLGLLFLVIVVLWIRSEEKQLRYLAYFALCLLTQTHALFAILGFAFGVALSIEWIRNLEKRKELTFFLPILFTFGLLFLYSVYPPIDSQFSLGENANPQSLRISLSYAFFPIFAESKLSYYGAWVLLFLLGFLFRKDLFTFLVYAFGVTGIILFFRFVYVSHLHHLSVLYSHALLSSVLFFKNQERSPNFNIISGVFYFLSFIQIVFFIQIESKDLTQEFSGSKSAVKILNDCGYEPTKKIAGHGPDEAKTILIYLPSRSQMYFPALDAYGSFMKWNRKFRESYKLEETVLLERMEAKSISFAIWNRPLQNTKDWELCGANDIMNVLDINEIFYVYKHK